MRDSLLKAGTRYRACGTAAAQLPIWLAANLVCARRRGMNSQRSCFHRRAEHRRPRLSAAIPASRPCFTDSPRTLPNSPSSAISTDSRVQCWGSGRTANRKLSGFHDAMSPLKFYKGSIKVEVKKKHSSIGRNFSCFTAHLIEQDLF